MLRDCDIIYSAIFNDDVVEEFTDLEAYSQSKLVSPASTKRSLFLLDDEKIVIKKVVTSFSRL